MDRALPDHIDAVPDATLTEVRQWLAAEHALVAGRGTVGRAVARLDRPRKKEPDRHGTRLVATVPRNHGRNVTCLAALTALGVGPSLAFEGGAEWIGLYSVGGRAVGANAAAGTDRDPGQSQRA